MNRLSSVCTFIGSLFMPARAAPLSSHEQRSPYHLAVIAVVMWVTLLLFSALSGCTVFETKVVPTITKGVDAYCAKPQAERLLIRAQVNDALSASGAHIVLTCPGDATVPVADVVVPGGWLVTYAGSDVKVFHAGEAVQFNPKPCPVSDTTSTCDLARNAEFRRIPYDEILSVPIEDAGT